MRAASLALLLGLVQASSAAAQEAAQPMNRVGFAVESTREVDNDRVVAVAGVTFEDADPARLADRINTDMGWALARAKARPELQVRTGAARTWPIEDPKRQELRRWRGTQELVIEGHDVAVVSALLGELQERLQLVRIDFGISPERRRAVEGELVDEVLEAFRARADRIQRKLGALRWQLVEVQLDTGGGGPVPVRGRAMMMSEQAAAPALEEGTSTLEVRARGTIELVF